MNTNKQKTEFRKEHHQQDKEKENLLAQNLNDLTNHLILLMGYLPRDKLEHLEHNF